MVCVGQGGSRGPIGDLRKARDVHPTDHVRETSGDREGPSGELGKDAGQSLWEPNRK